jgi:hypothetical protein
VTGGDSVRTIASITLIGNNNPSNHAGFIGQLFLKNTSGGTIQLNSGLFSDNIQVDNPGNTIIYIAHNGYVTGFLLCNGLTYFLNFTGPYNP